jgi:hypothetical protein
MYLYTCKFAGLTNKLQDLAGDGRIDVHDVSGGLCLQLSHFYLTLEPQFAISFPSRRQDATFGKLSIHKS